MSITSRKSSRNPGIGVMSAITMASTANGTASSAAAAMLNLGNPPGRDAAIALVCDAIVYLLFINLKMYARISATALYRAGGISCPTSAEPV